MLHIKKVCDGPHCRCRASTRDLVRPEVAKCSDLERAGTPILESSYTMGTMEIAM